MIVAVLFFALWCKLWLSICTFPISLIIHTLVFQYRGYALMSLSRRNTLPQSVRAAVWLDLIEENTSKTNYYQFKRKVGLDIVFLTTKQRSTDYEDWHAAGIVFPHIYMSLISMHKANMPVNALYKYNIGRSVHL